MADAASLIREAKLAERTHPLCLRPDLVREYEQTQQKITGARRAVAATDSMVNAAADTAELEAQLGGLEGEMRASTIEFVFRALPRPRFRALWSAHPPRKDDEDRPIKEDLIGVNTSTFWPVLIRETAVTPELDEETWTILLDEKLSDRQFFDLANIAFDLCQEKVDLPFPFSA